MGLDESWSNSQINKQWPYWRGRVLWAHISLRQSGGLDWIQNWPNYRETGARLFLAWVVQGLLGVPWCTPNNPHGWWKHSEHQWHVNSFKNWHGFNKDGGSNQRYLFLCCGESGDAARYQQTGANRRPPHISGYHWNLNGRVDLLGWTATGEMDTQSIQWCSDGCK